MRTVTSQNEKTSLLGKTKQDYASIVRWMSFVYFEINPKIGASLGPLTGAEPYNKKLVDENLKGLDKACSVLNDHLLVHTFLVGERITLADLFCAGLLIRGFDNFFDKKWREEYPNVTRWYETIHHQPIYSSVVPPINLISEAIKYTPPKKEEKPKQAPKQEKAAPKPKAKEVDDEEEEEDKPAPKPKHPLEALPKSTIPIDEWKRKYSNEETREVALPWFWQSFYNPEEYSLWKVDYKYNDELTMTFMTSNLIGMSFDKLSPVRLFLSKTNNVVQVASSPASKDRASTSSARPPSSA